MQKPGRAWLFSNFGTTRTSCLFSAVHFDCFCSFWTIQQLDERHRCIVANAETHLQDAQVAAVTICVTWAQFSEQLDDHFTIAQAIESEALVNQAISLAQSQDRLDHAAQF